MAKELTDSSIRLPIVGLADRYRLIDRGAAAVLLVESWDCAVRLAISCCLDAPGNRDLFLVGRQVQRRTASYVRQHAGVDDLSGITVRTAQQSLLAHRCPLQEFGFSLPYVTEPGHDAVIVFDADEVPLTKPEDLLRRLRAIEERARESHCALLLIFHCSKREEFHLQMNACRSAVSGLAECLSRGGRVLWKTFFWNCLNQHSGEFAAILSDAADGIGFECLTLNSGDVVSDQDADVVWSASPKIAPDTCKIGSLLTADGNEELFRIGLKANSATLVFSIAKLDDIARVGRHIHELRVHRGPRLRIAAVAGEHPMRSSSMAFLLSCGANIVFDHNATVDYIRLMLSAIKGTIYPHAPLADFEHALEAIVGEHQTGLVACDKFLSFVEAEVTYHADWLDVHGALVMLTPVPGLTCKECMEHFDPRRAGDFGTYTPKAALVYLPGCLPGFVELALGGCFALAPSDLFASYRAVYDDMEILAQIKQIRNRNLETKPLDNESFSMQSAKSDDKKTEAVSPKLLQPNVVRPQPLKQL